MSESLFHPEIVATPRKPASPVHRWLGVAWLTIALTNVLAPATAVLPFTPYYPMVGLYVLYFAFTRPRQLLETARRPFFWVWLLTAVASLVLYAFSDQSYPAYSSMRMRITFFASLAGSIVILVSDDAREMLRTSAKITLVVAIVLNVLELAMPGIVGNDPGRSAGLYGNPNVAATTIGLCLILALDFASHRPRGFWWMSAGYVGIVATFSRSGMFFGILLWGAYLFFPRGRDALPAGNRIMTALGIFVAAAVLGTVALQVIDIGAVGEYQLKSMLSPSTSDGSAVGRIHGFKNAWNEWQRHPWGGLGIGALDSYWMGSHNTYLAIALEFGVFALFLYLVIVGVPLLKGLAVSWERGSCQVMLVVCVLYWGMWDHSIASEVPFAVVFAAFATDALILPGQRRPAPAPADWSESFDYPEPEARIHGVGVNAPTP